MIGNRNCQPCGPAPCTGECQPWRYDGPEGLREGSGGSAGTDDTEPTGCDLCDARAVLVSEDLEYLCHRCCQEINAEVRRPLIAGY
jgi:hypothetical protein